MPIGWRKDLYRYDEVQLLKRNLGTCRAMVMEKLSSVRLSIDDNPFLLANNTRFGDSVATW